MDLKNVNRISWSWLATEIFTVSKNLDSVKGPIEDHFYFTYRFQSCEIYVCFADPDAAAKEWHVRWIDLDFDLFIFIFILSPLPG